VQQSRTVQKQKLESWRVDIERQKTRQKNKVNGKINGNVTRAFGL
jgi:hypothetical protein